MAFLQITPYPNITQYIDGENLHLMHKKFVQMIGQIERECTLVLDEP